MIPQQINIGNLDTERDAAGEDRTSSNGTFGTAGIAAVDVKETANTGTVLNALAVTAHILNSQKVSFGCGCRCS